MADGPEHEQAIGTESAAAAAAAGAGLMVGAVAGGPIGSIAGAALGPPALNTFRHVYQELRSRSAGPREVERMQTAWRVSLEEIARRLEAGELPRVDFLDPGAPSGPPAAEELLEEISRIAGESADHRKAPLVGRLHAALLFERGMTAEHARFLCRLASDLTFHEMLCVAAATPSLGWKSRNAFAQERERLPRTKAVPFIYSLGTGIEATLDRLSTAGLVGLVDEKKLALSNPPVHRPEALWAGDDAVSVWADARLIRATELGVELVKLTRPLDDLEPAELDEFLKALWRNPPPHLVADGEQPPMPRHRRRGAAASQAGASEA